MFEVPAEAAARPITCSVCQRSSFWHAAFVPEPFSRGQRHRCPRCAAREMRKSARRHVAVFAAAVCFAGLLLAADRHSAVTGVVLFWLVFTLSIYPLVLLHEIGHAVAARLVRAPAYAIVLGVEPWLLDREYLGIRWRIGSYIGGGLTYHSVCEGRNARARAIAVTAAGPLINFVFAAAAWAVAVSLPGAFASSGWKATLVIVALSSLFLGLSNSWPRTIATPAGKIPNDAAKILGLLRNGELERPEQGRAAQHFMIGTFAYGDQDFRRCDAEMLRAQEAWPGSPLESYLLVMRAAALSESDQPAAAAALLRPLELDTTINPGVRSGVLDNLAWAYLLLDEPALIEQAIPLVSKAREIAPWEQAYVICHACLLAASAHESKARAVEARCLLGTLSPAEFNRPCSAYAALASALLLVAEGDFDAARRSEQRARRFGATAAPLRLLERRLASN